MPMKFTIGKKSIKDKKENKNINNRKLKIKTMLNFIKHKIKIIKSCL